MILNVRQLQSWLIRYDLFDIVRLVRCDEMRVSVRHSLLINTILLIIDTFESIAICILKNELSFNRHLRVTRLLHLHITILRIKIRLSRQSIALGCN